MTCEGITCGGAYFLGGAYTILGALVFYCFYKIFIDVFEWGVRKCSRYGDLKEQIDSIRSSMATLRTHLHLIDTKIERITKE